MIYLEENTIIPVPIEVTNATALILQNKQTFQEVTVDISNPTLHKFFIEFEANYTSIEDGYYTFKLMNGEEEITNGVALKGNYNPVKTEYQKNNTNVIYERE